MWPSFPSDFPLSRRFVFRHYKECHGSAGSYKTYDWKYIFWSYILLYVWIIMKTLQNCHNGRLSVVLYLSVVVSLPLSAALRRQPPSGPSLDSEAWRSQSTTTDWKQLWTSASSEQWDSSKPRPPPSCRGRSPAHLEEK